MSENPSWNEKGIHDALRDIPIPYVGTDVVTAHMIRDIVFRESSVSLTLAFPMPSRGFREAFIRKVQEAIRKGIPGIEDVEISAVTDIPRTGGDKQSVLPGVKNTVAVASGKGGVGKSTVAVNIAAALAREGARVGLLDADIYGPNIPLMLGIDEAPPAYSDNGKVRLLPIERHGVHVMSIGFLIERDSALIWRGPMASNALKQLMTEVNWGELDYLIFDLPPGTGDIPLTLAQTLPLSGAVIVTTPQDVSLADARKGSRMFERVSVPILGLIENMSYYVCPHCGARDDIFGNGGGKAAAEEMDVPFLGALPLATRLREACDRGIPLVDLEPESFLAETFLATARSMAGRIAFNALTAPVQDIDVSLKPES
ncbi:MAG: iron-sulfur cluster carrier protein ApbC [Bacteroidota bacterium]|nr:iron-sulfur cluster carrier protein ApbC [Bacteroidota bacterium]